MFRLGIVPKENFLAYSTRTYSRLVRGNVVTIDMCGNNPIMGEWIHGITWKHVYFNTPGFFIVDTTSMSKLVFSIAHCFCLDSHLSGCVAVIINDVVSLFLCYCNGYSYLCNDDYHHYCYFCDPCHILV